MGKRLSLSGAIGVLFAALSVAPAAAADELTSCIQSSTVCFSDGASISDSDAVTQALEGKAHVAVVANDDSNSLNPNQLASQIAQNSGTSELILVVDMAKDRFGVYSESGRGDEILRALNSTGMADGGEAIVAASIGDLYSSPVANSNAGDGGGFPVLAVVLPAVAVVAVIGGAVGVLKRRSRKPQESESRPTAASLREQRSVEISEELRKELNGLSATADRYGRASSRDLQEASKLIGTAIGHIYELFKRIDKKKSRQNREVAQVRYLDTARKLNSTLSADYFEDIVRKPDLWDNASEKIAAVLSALESVDRQVIENIKQVNSSKALEFRVAVDSLIGTEGIGVEEAFGKDSSTMDRKVTDPFRRS